MSLLNAYKEGYFAGYYLGPDLALPTTYKGEELRQYRSGFEQGEIDQHMGLPCHELNGFKDERQPH